MAGSPPYKATAKTSSGSAKVGPVRTPAKPGKMCGPKMTSGGRSMGGKRY